MTHEFAPSMVRIAVLLLLGAASTGCAPPVASTAPGAAAHNTYQNPVLDQDFPDPTVIAAPDGWYYAYATQGVVDGRPVNIQVARSRDLTDWQTLGDALPAGPAWATRVRNFWAPDVHYDASRGEYRMYYSAHSDDTDAKCLAVAVARDPAGPFTDVGQPLLCGPGFVNIDPMAFDDPVSGRRLLYWGSGFEPIKVRELAPDGRSFADGSEATPVVSPGRDSTYNVLIEGAWVVYRGGYYHLFYSGDNCCGESAHYAVMVARARSPEGPFERLGQANGTGNSAILEQKGTWTATGHNSVVTDAAGQDWIAYHGINRSKPHLDAAIPDDRSDRRVMLLDRLEYYDGWPRVAGNGPTEGPTPAPAVSP